MNYREAIGYNVARNGRLWRHDQLPAALSTHPVNSKAFVDEVAAFQRIAGITVDGKLGSTTLKWLLRLPQAPDRKVYAHGIDVHVYQESKRPIDWPAVLDRSLPDGQRIDFVVCKVAQGDTAKKAWRALWDRTRRACADHGVLAMVYAFSSPEYGYDQRAADAEQRAADDARREVKVLLDAADLVPGLNGIPWNDVESGWNEATQTRKGRPLSGLSNKREEELNVAHANAWADAALERLGAAPGIYTAQFAIDAYLDDAPAEDFARLAVSYPWLWWAEYGNGKLPTRWPTKDHAPWRRAQIAIHQYTGHGRVQGITGDVDRNIALVDLAKLTL